MSREQRKLAAILAADAVGYSRLMGRDEAGTLARLKAHRSERLEPALSRNGGRLVKLTGDGALAEFGSAVDALRAAIEFQQAVAEVNRDQPVDTAIAFRIGLHLGDLIVEGGDLYGDGVNIAARLEGQAQAGGIVISRAIHEAVEGRLKVSFHDLGEVALKNIERPVRAFRAEWVAAEWTVANGEAVGRRPAGFARPAIDMSIPDEPSIAVLPFTNMSADPEQEFFTDGITEDIITELARFRSLFVIARNSSFFYKGRSPDVREVGRELGVRYVLEGSIRKSSNRIRVTGQLVDTVTGSHIWAERYDRVLEDVFLVQEELTRSIVAAIAPQIDSTETFRANRRPAGSLSAYEIGLRARASAWAGWSKADRSLLDQSIRDAKEALQLDPSSVLALQTLAAAHGCALFLQMAVKPDEALREARWAAARAVELDSTDARSYAQKALVDLLGYQFGGRLSGALTDARRAHEMNPNDTYALMVLTNIEAVTGDPKVAIELSYKLLRLNPRDAFNYQTYNTISAACFSCKQYGEGVRWALLALHDAPKLLMAHYNHVTCLVGLGEVERAKDALATARELAPEYFQSRLEGATAWGRPDDRERSRIFTRIAANLEHPGKVDRL